MTKKKTMITAIVCADENYGIGRNNKLLIHISDDLKRFSKLTRGGTVIMGRKTYESLPNAPLPNRVNLVITRNEPTGSPDKPIEGFSTFVSMEQIKTWLLQKKKDESKEKISVIGGAQIYQELLPYCDIVELTKVFKVFDDADTYFPKLDESTDWVLIDTSEVMEYKGIKYQYCRYRNTNPIQHL